MAMSVTSEEFEDAALVLIVDQAGNYRWSSDHKPGPVAAMLRAIAAEVEDGTSDATEGLNRVHE